MIVFFFFLSDYKEKKLMFLKQTKLQTVIKSQHTSGDPLLQGAGDHDSP